MASGGLRMGHFKPASKEEMLVPNEQGRRALTCRDLGFFNSCSLLPAYLLELPAHMLAQDLRSIAFLDQVQLGK